METEEEERLKGHLIAVWRPERQIKRIRLVKNTRLRKRKMIMIIVMIMMMTMMMMMIILIIKCKYVWFFSREIWSWFWAALKADRAILPYLVSYYYTARSNDVLVLKSRWNFVNTKTTTPGNNIYTLLITLNSNRF